MYLASLFETTDDGNTFTFTVLTTAAADNLAWCESNQRIKMAMQESV